MKTTIAALKTFADMQPIENEFLRVRSEIENLAKLAKLLNQQYEKRLALAVKALAEN